MYSLMLVIIFLGVPFHRTEMNLICQLPPIQQSRGPGHPWMFIPPDHEERKSFESLLLAEDSDRYLNATTNSIMTDNI